MQKITVTLTICLFIWLAFVQSAPAEAKQKSEQAALYWSLGSTLIPTVVGLPMVARDKMDLEAIGAPLIIGGLLIGPSAGHWYAGEHGRGWTTIGVRLGLSVIGLIAVGDLVRGAYSEGNYAIGENISKVTLGAAALGFLSSIIYDIAAAPSSARHHNEKIKDAKSKQYGLSATYLVFYTSQNK